MDQSEKHLALTVSELRVLLDQCQPDAPVFFAWAGGVSEVMAGTFYLDAKSGALIINDGSASHPEQKNGEWKLLK